MNGMNNHLAPEDMERQARLASARLHDPFSFLGPHQTPDGHVYRVFLPHASNAWLHTGAAWAPMQRFDEAGIFVWHGGKPAPRPARVRVESEGSVKEVVDAYGFQSSISDFELHLFGAGRLYEAYRALGAIPMHRDGVAGVRFAVWAPNAERVSVVGDFNRWDGRVHPMQSRGSSGVWELFVPDIPAGEIYKFEIRSRDSGALIVKTDPYAQAFERRPATGSLIAGISKHAWGDGEWLARRQHWDWQHSPISIYELHAGSWRRHPDGSFYTYAELAAALIPYIRGLGYTHIELMPVTEHPLDESWGYQTTGYFAPTSRFGTPDGLRAFVDECHRNDIGVILDWVPGHFPADDFALAHFDGTALYEHADPRLKRHPDWGTHVFNYGRAEVRSFLLASAHYWLSEFHMDGLRVDAVASMLYLDYSRSAGEWVPNRFGGRENLEAIEFLRDLNVMVHECFPGAVTCAEESTAWPLVSRPTYLGGLGFSMKWNMGWMHDTLQYVRHDPIHRRYHQDLLTFGQLYAYSENFVLPFSHDEVVHGKGSLVGKIPGDPWQQFATLRLLAAYQYTYPGKKLNFMGSEFGQGREWNASWELDWPMLADALPAGLHHLVGELNRLYRDTPALHELDFAPEGFQWIDCHDSSQSVIGYLRKARDGRFVIVILNFTPVPRRDYRIGVPEGGGYVERLNTDSRYYGGSNLGNGGTLEAVADPWMNFPCSLRLTLPPLAALVISRA